MGILLAFSHTPGSHVKFRAVKRDGSISPGAVRVVAYTITGALNSIAGWHDAKGPDTAKAVAEALVAVLVQRLEPRGSC